MSKLDDMLKKYDHIVFQGRGIHPFHWQIQDGWWDIVEPVIALIDQYNKAHPDDMIVIWQVKQKFGALRFYTKKYTDELDHAIGYASMLSESICERCGDPGENVIRNRWVSIKCGLHQDD